MEFGARMLTSVRSDLLPLLKSLLDSRLASCPLRTHRIASIFIGFVDFHGFSQMSTDFHGFRGMDAYIGKIGPVALIESFARFQAGFSSSEDSHRI